MDEGNVALESSKHNPWNRFMQCFLSSMTPRNSDPVTVIVRQNAFMAQLNFDLDMHLKSCVVQLAALHAQITIGCAHLNVMVQTIIETGEKACRRPCSCTHSRETPGRWTSQRGRRSSPPNSWGLFRPNAEAIPLRSLKLHPF